MTWAKDDDIAMIKNACSWPCPFALPLKKSSNIGEPPTCGCLTPDDRTTIIMTSIWDFDPGAEKIKYDSVEKMVEDGWMVD